jgi:putative ABC transport system ATP-binding protein
MEEDSHQRDDGKILLLKEIQIVRLKEADLVKRHRDNLGFVFQQFYLMPTLTARENIDLPLLFSHKNENRGKVDAVLEMVGLRERGNHLSSQLSGAECNAWPSAEL